MHIFIVLYCFFVSVSIYLVNGECVNGCDLPINIYEQLQCRPKFDNDADCCPKQYDCSNIFQRPEGTCHLRGKFYKIGETVSNEDIAENCHTNCHCAESLQFECLPPTKSCHEYYVPDYPKQGCYLQYSLDSCCASGQACPPFDNVSKCNVSGTIYKQGQRFAHPLQKCTKCVCSEGFDGTVSSLECKRKNCTTEILYSKEIEKYCAPYYIGGTCCPAWWTCPAEGGEYIATSKIGMSLSGPQCRFGDKMMDIGSKYLYQSQYSAKVVCECIMPPFLTCFEQTGE